MIKVKVGKNYTLPADGLTLSKVFQEKLSAKVKKTGFFAYDKQSVIPVFATLKRQPIAAKRRTQSNEFPAKIK